MTTGTWVVITVQLNIPVLNHNVCNYDIHFSFIKVDILHVNGVNENGFPRSQRNNLIPWCTEIHLKPLFKLELKWPLMSFHREGKQSDNYY